jgi:hypothetical protein
VYITGGTFTMSGSASIHTDNRVYLNNNKVITLSGILSANPAANIENPTAGGVQVLADDTATPDNDISTDNNYTKFLINGVPNRIDEYGVIIP